MDRIKSKERMNKTTLPLLVKDIRELIEDARQKVAGAVNTGLTMLYWQIGVRIRKDILREKRAKYGEEILPTLSAKLLPEFGSGYSTRNLSRMIRFAEFFPETEVFVSLSRHLGWSHFFGSSLEKEVEQRGDADGVLPHLGGDMDHEAGFFEILCRDGQGFEYQGKGQFPGAETAEPLDGDQGR